MRIVSGQFKGHPISAPKTRDTRPTSDRARESLFNILAHAAYAPDLQGARVLDLFAGSGALGLEALSRGAAVCVFIETGRAARAAIQSNITALGVSEQARLHHRGATDPGSRPAAFEQPFDLVFADPPYGKGLVRPCFEALQAGDWIGTNTLLVAETGMKESLDIPELEVIADRKIGAARVWFLKPGAKPASA